MDTVREYPSGEVVVEEGTRGTAAFVILSGTADVFERSGGLDLVPPVLPFLVGRDSRNAESDVFYNNDLTVTEQRPYVVSRNHLAVAPGDPIPTSP